jgi:arginase
MIEVIAAPFDGSGARRGSRLGPAALELAGLREALAEQGHPVTAWHEAELDRELLDAGQAGLKNFDALISCIASIRSLAGSALTRGAMPLVLGGEHSIALGGVSAALAHTRGDLALLWIDAHADLNIPDNSPSGNLHGMPIAALNALPCKVGGLIGDQWRALADFVGHPHLALSRCAWFGLRDVDAGERQTISSHPECLPITMQDVDRHGIVESVARLDRWLRATGAQNLYISFDVDVLDPALAPGTGTAVRGGLTYREGHLIAELLEENLSADGCPYKLVGMDLVEVNPGEDINNTTARVAVEWLASLFGKTILGPGASR